MRLRLSFAGLALAASLAGAPAGYTEPAACAGCHPTHAESFLQTGMGRSFFRAIPANMVEDFARNTEFFHEPSQRYYRLVRRGDEYFLRRHQKGYGGQETNVLERRIDYVMGSGNHVRSYVHRTPQNRLIELPVSWYPENGGFFAMSPGYDYPAHLGFRRQISFDCMFCHNAYPDVPAGANALTSDAIFPDFLPQGIDCQRCHGPGAAHVAAARKSTPDPAALRASIVNPARLSPDRQMEVCMQCHLETTSFALPNSIQRPDRGTFSYRPGEPLEQFVLHFDHAPGSGREDKFEIVNSVYRLRQSACFQKSGGQLVCTTCHNPHQAPRGVKASEQYTAACRGCHANLATVAGHPTGDGCLDCHMPKRRTEDVVNAVMTDHLIQRNRPARDLLAPLAERREIEGKTAYQGEVVLYYPPKLASAAGRDLYLGLAQVLQKSNVRAGAPRLAAALARYQPKHPVFYFELAQAYLWLGSPDRAIVRYQQALARDPAFLPALRSLGAALREQGQPAKAAAILERAVRARPEDATAHHELGRAYQALGRLEDAVKELEAATRFDGDFPEAYNSLGGARFETGDRAASEAALRTAIALQPDYADAHNNLANVLAANGDFPQAEYHFQAALDRNPKLVAARFTYGAVLAASGRFVEAEEQLAEAVRLEPDHARAQELLGNLCVNRGDLPAGIAHYREAVRAQPAFARAHLALGSALGASGDLAGARSHLMKAAAAQDPAIRQEAAELLKAMDAPR